MKVLEIDVQGIEERGVIADIPENMQLDMIYNNYDNFLYVSILDSLGNVLTGFQKLVPSIDYLGSIRHEKGIQIRCIKVNDFAEEKDRITPKNLNKDYKFFIIGSDEVETLEAS